MCKHCVMEERRRAPRFLSCTGMSRVGQESTTNFLNIRVNLTLFHRFFSKLNQLSPSGDSRRRRFPGALSSSRDFSTSRRLSVGLREIDYISATSILAFRLSLGPLPPPGKHDHHRKEEGKLWHSAPSLTGRRKWEKEGKEASDREEKATNKYD